MTIDEAIKQIEEIAEDNQRIVDTHRISDELTIDELYCDDTEIIEEQLAGYQKAAEDYSQLAEWLKDYKRLLEQEPTTKNNLAVDCIERAQAQTEIQMNARRYSIAKEFGGAGQVEWSDYLISIKDALGILRNLPSVTPATRWIPVTEDTPPKGTVCLWCNKQRSVFASEITCRTERDSYVGKHGYFSNGLENYGNIVAWMPLPEPFKESEE